MPWDKSVEAFATQMASHAPCSSKWQGFRLQMTFLSPPSTWCLGTDPGPAGTKGSLRARSRSTLEKQEGRNDNSHEVHVDNCILNAEALVCVKEPPAYTFRDYRYGCCLSARASPPEGTVTWWHLGWEEQGGRATQLGSAASGSCRGVGGAPDSPACWSYGDGCHLCLSPASFSAILYLNGDFEGGAFYFTELDAKTETVSSSTP